MNRQDRTNRTIPNNKPDNITHANTIRTCISIDVAFPADRNVTKKEAEKLLKYKDLITEIQRMWNVKNKNDTSNNSGDWNHFKITQTIPEQRAG